jgi:glycosyltransferase involved in cell wall biosynthesis
MLGLPPDAKIVLFIGRFNPQKGISTLLEVARRTLAERDGVIFLLVGDGELMPDAKMCAQTFGARMILAGQHRDVSRFYAAADLLFLPSRTEGLPMALIEAFAWGVPAIASNVGGIPEVVVDGVNGFLCDPMNSAHMCERLLQILSNDALRQSFGAHARSTAEANFSLERMSLETYRVYQQLCQGGRVATVD